MAELDEGRLEERRLVERIREGWGRPELTPGERAAFDARLWERLEGREEPTRWPLMAAGAVLAALAVVVAGLWVAPVEDDRAGREVDQQRKGGASLAVASWLEALLPAAPARAAAARTAQNEPSAPGESVVAWLAEPSADGGLTALLPDEYALLASWVAPGAPTYDRESH